MKLNPKALGYAVGITKGLVVCLATIYVSWMQGGETLQLLNRFYLGYTVSYTGAFVGLAYGLVDGFIIAFVVATLYNLFAKE